MASLLSARGLSGLKVLDIGGSGIFWQMNARYLPDGLFSSIDVMNLPPHVQEAGLAANISLRFFEGNALDPGSYPRDHYDLVHSNSVLEHVGSLKNQKVMAEAIRNGGTYYWVQTPAKHFPLEPHFYFPFFTFLPLSVRTCLHQNFSLGHMGKQPDWLEARIACEETRLLTRRELASMFPDGKVLNERLLGLVKSRVVTNLVEKT